MTMLLKKIESLESKIKALATKWKEMKDENARLLQDNSRLRMKLDDMSHKLEEVMGERGKEDKANALKPEVKQAIDECIHEMEEGLELLREYKNGI